MAEAVAPRAGLVVALQANFCWVSLDEPGPEGVRRLLCTRRTRLGKSGLRICAGDRVCVEGIDWGQARGAVSQRGARRNQLDRPAVANIDRIVVVIALAEPEPEPLQLTRFLLTAEATGASVQLVLSKADLVSPQAVERWQQRLAGWGYDALPIGRLQLGGEASALEPLRRQLATPGVSVVCGPSGVGKSSLLNALLPDRELRVGSVSGRLRRGRHTTRHVELFPMEGSDGCADPALVADTPGFNRPDLTGPSEALAALFPEIRQRLSGARCRYSDCAHLDDAGCAVGSDWDRCSQYRQLLEELRAQEAQQSSRQEAVPPRGGLHAGQPQLLSRGQRHTRQRWRGEDGADQP